MEIPAQEIETLYDQLKKDAESKGYHLNPDVEFTRDLVKGLLVNQQRYGYQSCPCRLGANDYQKDLDIICPCDYRDPDLDDFGACYCGLYVDSDVLEGKKELKSIPERRQVKSKSETAPKEITGSGEQHSILIDAILEGIKIPVWRCKVCGYLCAREKPPGICPICKVTRDRFERFL